MTLYLPYSCQSIIIALVFLRLYINFNATFLTNNTTKLSMFMLYKRSYNIFLSPSSCPRRSIDNKDFIQYLIVKEWIMLYCNTWHCHSTTFCIQKNRFANISDAISNLNSLHYELFLQDIKIHLNRLTTVGLADRAPLGPQLIFLIISLTKYLIVLMRIAPKYQDINTYPRGMSLGLTQPSLYDVYRIRTSQTKSSGD